MQPLTIIQARMGSSRFPGKIMVPINGTTAIELMIKRLSRHPDLQNIVVATSTAATDDVFCAYLNTINVRYIRGSEDNVLQRFHDAIDKYPADNIVRATGDCPFIDPDLVIELICAFSQENADYAYLSPKFAEGLDVEVFTKNAIEVANLEAALESEREHVTLFLSNNPDRFKIIKFDQNQDHSAYRFTLDTPEDLEVINAIADEFKTSMADVQTNEIIEYLNNNPKVFEKNNQIIRNEGLMKSLANDKLYAKDDT